MPTTINAVPAPKGVLPGQICGPPGSVGYTATGQLLICSVMDKAGRFFWSSPAV
jgi:hypothetical protein